MTLPPADLVEEAKRAALEVLWHNANGPFAGLPRTAGWGYPEPYTRDLMIASLGILVSGDEVLVSSLRRVLKTLARNQTRLGHIPSLVHDSEDLGASDTMPLFLIALALFRKAAGKGRFLEGPARKALAWMDYQSPENRALVAQQPTSDWRGSPSPVCVQRTGRRRSLPLPPRFGPGPGQRSRSSGLALCVRGSLERQLQGAI